MAKERLTIAFEISPLITASGAFGDKSGVYRYTLGMIKGLLLYAKKEKLPLKIVLFSFSEHFFSFPLNNDVLELLKEDNVVSVQRSVKKKLYLVKSNSLLKSTLLKYPLWLLNKIFKLGHRYRLISIYMREKDYRQYLALQLRKLKVSTIHHSETGFYPLKGFKHVVTIYDLTSVFLHQFHREETNDLQDRKLTFAEMYCDGVVCISESTKKDLINYVPQLSYKKMVVCYPTIAPVFLSDPRTERRMTITDLNAITDYYKYRLLVSKKYLLYYGTFEPRKNIYYLIQAFCKLQDEKRVSNDFKLVLIGGTGWGDVWTTISNFINENYPVPRKRNILTISYINDTYLKAFIRNAYAVVYPSLYEGFGLPVLESMTLGTPVVCSDTSSLPEVGGDAVVYLNPKDISNMEDQIQYIIDNPEIAKQNAKKGKKRTSLFTAEKSAGKLYKFLKDL